MKHTITPEQFAVIEDAPGVIDDFAIKSLKLPYNAEAGAYALVKVPDNWDGKLMARVHFKCNGIEDASASVYVSANFYQDGVALPTNSASALCTASVSGSAGNVASSDIQDIDCTGCAGTVVNVKVGLDTAGTTEDMPVDIVMVELFIGTF